jgi:hypothetical protein
MASDAPPRMTLDIRRTDKHSITPIDDTRTAIASACGVGGQAAFLYDARGRKSGSTMAGPRTEA